MEKVLKESSPLITVDNSLDEKNELSRMKDSDDERKLGKPLKRSRDNIAQKINSSLVPTEEVSSDTEYEPPAKSQKSIPRTHNSPKKRLNIPAIKKKSPFIYGNYSRYYGYRNLRDFHDVRLDIFAEHKDLFEGKECLDVGCNTGLITMEIAKKFHIKHITGIDIDKSLIKRAIDYVQKIRKTFVGHSKATFPFNVEFVHGNYVLIDDVLLEIETEQFDLIICLSVTKWIHLNFGDSGLKQVFKRMLLQLRPGGKLILEAQPWSGYKKRKQLSPTILENYKSIQLFPKDFTNYLLGPEVGFSEVQDLGVPSHCSEGFRRPIKVFIKKENPETQATKILVTN